MTICVWGSLIKPNFPWKKWSPSTLALSRPLSCKHFVHLKAKLVWLSQGDLLEELLHGTLHTSENNCLHPSNGLLFVNHVSMSPKIHRSVLRLWWNGYDLGLVHIVQPQSVEAQSCFLCWGVEKKSTYHNWQLQNCLGCVPNRRLLGELLVPTSRFAESKTSEGAQHLKKAGHII